jgi:hypothetical protein
MRKIIVAGILITAAMGAREPLLAQAATDEVAQLRQRVAQLEKQVQEISQLLEPLKAQQAADIRRKELRSKFEKRMAQDREKHSQEQLRDAENLIRIADQQWGSPEANDSLQTLIKKYPDFNRAGCALLYVAQRAEGDNRFKYLKECIEKYDDCFYGDGVQVGAYARFLLAEDYKRKGEEERRTALCREIKARYADAIDHSGKLLIDSIKTESKPQ